MKLPAVSGKKAIKAFCKLGYVIERKRGSHIILIRAEPFFSILSVPDHRELKKGTLRQLLKDADITPQEFLGLL